MVETQEKSLTIKVDSEKVAKGDRLADQYENQILRQQLPRVEEIVTLLHKKLFTPVFAEGSAGVYRSSSGYIVGFGPETPEYYMVPRRMREFGLEADDRISKLRRGFNFAENVLDTAFWAHYNIVSIHPFPDGNGRVGRRAMNLILRKYGLKPILIGPRTKQKYLDTLEKVSSTGDLNYLNLFLARALYGNYLGSEYGSDLQYEYIIRGYIKKIEKRFTEKYG